MRIAPNPIGHHRLTPSSPPPPFRLPMQNEWTMEIWKLWLSHSCKPKVKANNEIMSHEFFRANRWVRIESDWKWENILYGVGNVTVIGPKQKHPTVPPPPAEQRKEYTKGKSKRRHSEEIGLRSACVCKRACISHRQPTYTSAFPSHSTLLFSSTAHG